MKCPDCNSAIGDDWLICPNCGLDLSPLDNEVRSLNPLEQRAEKEGEHQSSINLPSSVNKFNKNKINNQNYILIIVTFSIILIGGIICLAVPSALIKTYKPTPSKIPKSSSTPGPTKTSRPNPSPTYPPIPNFTIRHFDQDKDGNLRNFWSEEFIPGFAWHTSPGRYFWNLEYLSNTPLLINIGWCALDKEILDQNLALITFIFTLDGYDITDRLETYDGTSQMVDKEWVCHSYSGVVENLSSGKHNFVYSQIFLQTLNDGLYDFKKGNYIENFKIDIP